jgi:hypothetical protein
MPTLKPKTAAKNKVKTEDAYGGMPVQVEGTGGDVGVAKKRRVAAYGNNKGGDVIRQTKGLYTYGPMA